MPARQLRPLTRGTELALCFFAATAWMGAVGCGRAPRSEAPVPSEVAVPTLSRATAGGAPSAVSPGTSIRAGADEPPRLLLTAAPDATAPQAPASPSTSSSAAPAPAEPPATRRCSVAVVGDSITDYASHGGRFIRELEKRCPESVFDNYGKGGDMINQMRRRFGALFAPGKPDYTHVVVFGGVNDLYSDLTAHRTNDKIQTDLTAMYEEAKRNGARVVAITVAPWGGFKKYWNARRGQATRDLNSWIQSQRGVSVDHVIDGHGPLLCGHPDALCPEYAKPFKDGLHLGPKGHEVLAQALHEQAFRECR